MGGMEVPAERLWGAQTQRSLENFKIGEDRMPIDLIHALARVKRASAQVNLDLGKFKDPAVGRAIIEAADEVIAGRHDAEFPLVVWQTGSGTQTNMNVERGDRQPGQRADGRRARHAAEGPSQRPRQHGPVVQRRLPHGHARRRRRGAAISRLIPSVRKLRDTLAAKAEEFAGLVKIGRTHLMDATPLTLGQEISGWVQLLDNGLRHVEEAIPHLSELALGGTAVGTGLNAHPEFAVRVARSCRS